ncbi:MAG: hypothetical protein AAF525_00555 [Pseudomonadota bacterium]
MNFRLINAAMQAEMRSTRRLFRYWVFAVLTVVAGIGFFFQMSMVHALGSSASATLAGMSPRFFIAGMGFNMLLFFLIGLTFLAFDVRTRDEREHMSEVLDTRPYSNLEFLLGRILGLTLMVWFSVLVSFVLVQIYGTLAGVFQWPIGETIEPFSVVGFLIYTFFMLFVWSAFLVFLSVVLKYRILVVIAGLAFLFLQGWAVFNLPLYQQLYVSIMPGFDLGSDIDPVFFAQGDGAKLITWILLAAGFTLLATRFHPRADGESGQNRLLAGVGVTVLGIAVYVGQIYMAEQRIEARNLVADFHEGYENHARTDIDAIKGDVLIEPGSNLGMSLILALHAPEDVEALVFTLNSGLNINALSVDGTTPDWEFRDGLLAIEHRLAAGDRAELTLTIDGVPNVEFGHLDQAIDLEKGDFSTGQMGMLGYLTSYYSSAYAALLPGGYWLPAAGSGIPSEDARRYPVDYYRIDINVTIPQEWTVAGPGKREATGSSGDTHSFRFAPDAWVTGVGLLASEFEQRAVTVGDTTFELLLSPVHAKSLTYFEDADEAIERTLTEMLEHANSLGLRYPYGQLSVVETPSRIRTYGGGWRMDTTQMLPGIMMTRETAFPAARFDTTFSFDSRNQKEEFEEGFEGGIGQAKVEALMRFSENDFNGGNVFQGVARNFLHYQTSARGDGALALNFMLNDLATRMLTERRGYFSAHMFGNGGFNVIMGQIMGSLGQGRTDAVSELVTQANTGRPSVWDRALESSLVELDTSENPDMVLNVLALKSSAITDALLNAYEREQLGDLLTELVARYQGTTFTADEFHALAAERGMDLTELLGSWLEEPGLPGFLISEVKTQRLQDTEIGQPQYQTSLHVRNGEATPGLFRIEYLWGVGKDSVDEMSYDQTMPVRLKGHEAVEIGIVTIAPLKHAEFHPYLSLNRRALSLLGGDRFTKKRKKVDSTERINAEPFNGVRPSTWHPDQDLPEGTLVVDDLDKRFQFHNANEVQSFNNPFIPFRVDMDQGIPAYQPFMGTPSWWARNSDTQDAVGRYRKTMAMKGAGSGDSWVAFDTDIPREGRWRLEYHLPQRFNKWMRWGTYDIQLAIGNDTRDIEFDSGAAQSGWNRLGDFDLSEGNVQLRVSDKTSGSIVIADAIRWRPLDEAEVYTARAD